MTNVAKTFWLVWDHGGGNPTVKHENYWGAQNEAQRLARLNPGRQFVVLEATHAFQVTDMHQTEFKHDADIPF
jgi:hypothetical protein